MKDVRATALRAGGGDNQRTLPDKIERSLFDPWVKRVFPLIEAKVPASVTANQVTLAGHFASLVAAAFLVLSVSSRWWCVAAVLMIFAHWFADTLDGPMARVRGVSDIGHYLDHFGDTLGVVLIGLAAFMTPGSHLGIGVAVVFVFLLSMVHTQLRAELTGVTVIPRFGPTELHIVAILALILQFFFDFGRPFSALSSVERFGNWIVALMGLKGGLTLIDHLGLFLAVAGLINLTIEVGLFLVRLKRCS